MVLAARIAAACDTCMAKLEVRTDPPLPSSPSLPISPTLLSLFPSPSFPTWLLALCLSLQPVQESLEVQQLTAQQGPIARGKRPLKCQINFCHTRALAHPLWQHKRCRGLGGAARERGWKDTWHLCLWRRGIPNSPESRAEDVVCEWVDSRRRRGGQIRMEGSCEIVEAERQLLILAPQHIQLRTRADRCIQREHRT
jgi:hypothetical protein